MAEEAQIVNRIVVQGIDEAKAQVQSLKQLLNETKAAYEQARRSTDQQGLFQGDNKSAQDLLKNVNSIQLQIAKLNSEISQGYTSMMGTQASYASQMSSLNAGIQQQFQLFRQGSIGQQEYAMALDKYTKGMSVAKAEQEAFSKSIGTYTSAWDRMRDRVASHASWIMAGGLIGAAIAIPGAALDSIVRMDKAMAGMNQVMDHTNTAAVAAGKGISEQAEQQNMLNAESQKFLTIAAQYGESVDNIVKAGAQWGRLYKDINVVNTLTAQSAKLAVADNFSLADANKAVESAMFQFGLTARNTSEALAYSGNVIDVWTKLAHNAGASAQDISQGVERAGSAAHQTGADFEFLSAQVATGVRATGRSGAEIGNMLKSLYGSFHSDKAIAELDKLGISVYKIGEDGTKQFRKAQDVMLDLAVTAQGTNQSLEETYKQISGGKFQWSKAGATLGDYKEFIRTWGEAVNSMGFTDKQVGMQLDTISRRMQTLKTDVQSIAVSGGQAGITTVLKDSISAVDNFVMGLKQIPAWSIEAAGGLAVAAKAFVVLKNAIVATNVASLASRATPLGAALTVLGIAAVAATEAMGGLANEQRNAARTAQDQISAAQQQQQNLEKQSEFADALFGAYQKLEAQLANSTEGTAQYNKALENQQETEKQLTGVLGEAAVQRIKDSGWSIDAYNQEKQAFEDGVTAKKKALQKMIDARVVALQAEKSTLETAIKNYWADASNFEESIKAKAKYLKWYEELWARFNNSQANAAQEQADKVQGKMDEVRGQIESYQGDIDTGEGKKLRDTYYQLYDLREKHLAEAEKYKSREQKVYESGIEGTVERLAQIDKETIDAQQQSMKLSEVPGGLKIATEPVDNTKGTKTAPMDTSEQIQKKLDNYNVKSIEDQAAIAQSNYKSRLDAITDATNRYGKSYAFLDQTTATMNQHVKDLQATTAALSEQLQSDLQKVNDLASETGATIEISGAANTGNAEGSTWTRETSDVNIEGLKGQAIDAISAVSQKFYELTGQQMVVSSGYRTWGGHTDATKFDVVDSASSSILEDNANGIRDAIVSYARSVGLEVIDEYTNPSANATAGHLDFEAAGFYGGTSGSRQITVSGLNDTLAAAGVSTEAWQGMSAESKLQFMQDHKEQVRDANLLIGYLTQIAGEQKKIADYQKQISDETRKQYETLVRGIKDVEDYQNKQTDLNKRTSLAALGYYATDSDKAIAEQKATREKIAQSNAALAYAKSKGVDIFTDPTMSEERVKNLELQQQLQQQNTFGSPEAAYKQRVAEIEYNQKIAQATFGNTLYDAQGKYMTSLTAAKDKVQALKDLLAEMSKEDSFAYQTETFKKYNVELVEAQKNLDTLSKEYTTKMKQGIYDVTNELLLQGKSIQDIWSNLWKKLAEDALMALMGLKNESPGLLAQALGVGKKSNVNQTSGVADGLNLLANATQKLGSISGEKSKETYDFISPNLLNSLVSGGSSGTQGSAQQKNTSQSGSTNWLSLVGSIAGMFHATGGVLNSPGIAGEDGEEVVIPVEKHKENSANLLSYAAGRLGQKSTGITADFSNADIAKTAMNVSVNSATNMAKTNGILATQNQILTTMLNQIGQQSGQQIMYVNAGGQQQITQEELSTMLYKNQQYRQMR